MQLDKIAAHDNRLHNLLHAARRWQQLDQSVKRLLPPNLHPHFRIVCIEDGSLIIHAAAPMAAGRLKMLLPALLPQLQQLDPAIAGVCVKMRPAHPATRPPKNFRISPHALSCFERTAHSVAHHPGLAQAIRNLVANNK